MGDTLVDLLRESHAYQGLSLWLRFIYSGDTRVIFRLRLLVRLGNTLVDPLCQSLPDKSRLYLWLRLIVIVGNFAIISELRLRVLLGDVRVDLLRQC